MSTQALRDWEAGRHQPTPRHLQRLAGFHGISLSELLRRSPMGVYSGQESSVAIPITGYLMAGEAEHPQPLQLGAINIPETVRQEHPRVFGLIVRGESLEIDGIKDGDIVLVDPEAELTEGSIEVVRIGDVLFPRLVPSAREPDREDPFDGSVAQTLGRAVWHVRRL